MEQLYKLGLDDILRWCILPEERVRITEAHVGIVGGHYGGRATTRKVLCTELWCLALHNGAVYYA